MLQSKGVGSSVTSFPLEISEVCVSVATHSLFFLSFWSVNARSAESAAAATAVWLLLIILFAVLSLFHPKRVFDIIVFGGDNLYVITT